MNFLKSLIPNVSDRAKLAAKTMFGAAIDDFKKTFKVLTPDLDVDATPEGILIVKVDNLGASAKVPYAGAIATAIHAGGVGNVEPTPESN